MKNQKKVIVVNVPTTDATLHLFDNANELTIEFLRQMLHEGVVELVYRDKSGELHRRKGTLVRDTITAEGYVFSNTKPLRQHPRYLTYWDLEKHNWRCLKVDRLIGYYGEERACANEE